MTNENPRNQTLKIDIIDGRLVISLGVETLAFAATHAQDWPEGWKIVDPDEFAREVISEMQGEDERRGGTIIGRALDEAFYLVAKGGTDAITLPSS